MYQPEVFSMSIGPTVLKVLPSKFGRRRTQNGAHGGNFKIAESNVVRRSAHVRNLQTPPTTGIYTFGDEMGNYPFTENGSLSRKKTDFFYSDNVFQMKSLS